jgi:hypothetical protein
MFLSQNGGRLQIFQFSRRQRKAMRPDSSFDLSGKPYPKCSVFYRNPLQTYRFTGLDPEDSFFLDCCGIPFL